ncbi:TPA: hypothetical protein DIC39_02325 [Patescibacteria group bacterium]|nr:hypothetical protein [Patescibacteria group bacterium]HCU47871.1 hypothetical protein [Patescibacteria group bacterium]
MSTKLQLSPSDVAAKFTAKISDIAIADKERETKTKADRLGMPYLNLVNFPIAQEALRLVDEVDAKKYKIIPFLATDTEARIGLVSPNAQGVAEFLAGLEQDEAHHYSYYLISNNSWASAVKHYKGLVKTKPVVAGVAINEADLTKFAGSVKDFSKVAGQLKKATTTDMVTIVIAGALELKASDIHVEAEEANVKIRYRLDGVLYDVASVSKEAWRPLITRLKLLAKLKLNIEAKPQDGRFTIFLTKDKVDVRVSCIPTAFGESVVMRLLRSSAAGLKFEDLGLRGRAYEILQEQIKRPNGMILATGPTGSGKTTTLYAILNKLNTSDNKIITLEDPIEYKLSGINQSQVDYNKGYDFARGLRSILRQDPDIVMVGEIRDTETADIAVNAALTGHLLISTMHTNSAASTVPRLLSMGVKPFLLTPALNAILGQRLVRLLCKECKMAVDIDDTTRKRVKGILATLPKITGYKTDTTKLKFYSSKGCKACNNLGYNGRTGLYEVLIITPEIEKAILSEDHSASQIGELAVKAGMMTIVQDGVLKALEGITSLEEVFKVAE